MSRPQNPMLSLRWIAAAMGVGLLAGLLPWIAGRNPLLASLLISAVGGGVILLAGWPLSAAGLLIFTALFTRYHFDVGPISVRPEHVAALAVATVGVAQWLVQRGRLRFPVAFWFALAWWATNMLSGALFTPDTIVGIQNAARLALMVLTFFLMVNLIPDRRGWWIALSLFLFFGVLEAAFGIIARGLYILGINVGVQVSWSFPVPIPYGTFEEGNLFGSHSAAWAIVLLALIVSGQVRRFRLTQLVGLLILLVALFLSLSRAAWLMFVGGAGLVWVFQRASRWHRLNRFLLLVTAAPFAVFLLFGLAFLLPSQLPFVDRLQSFASLSSDATFSARLEDWLLAIHDWLQRPLTGWGPGSFAVIHGLLRARPAWISNLSLRLVQETGILGALAFLGFVLALLLPAFKIGLRLHNQGDRAALLGLAISYVVLLLVAYQSTDGIWLAASWVHAGLIASGTYILPRADHPISPQSPSSDLPQLL